MVFIVILICNLIHCNFHSFVNLISLMMSVVEHPFMLC